MRIIPLDLGIVDEEIGVVVVVLIDELADGVDYVEDNVEVDDVDNKDDDGNVPIFCKCRLC